LRHGVVTLAQHCRNGGNLSTFLRIFIRIFCRFLFITPRPGTRITLGNGLQSRRLTDASQLPGTCSLESTTFKGLFSLIPCRSIHGAHASITFFVPSVIYYHIVIGFTGGGVLSHCTLSLVTQLWAQHFGNRALCSGDLKHPRAAHPQARAQVRGQHTRRRAQWQVRVCAACLWQVRAYLRCLYVANIHRDEPSGR